MNLGDPQAWMEIALHRCRLIWASFVEISEGVTLSGTFGDHEVLVACTLQLGIDPTTSAPRPQHIHVAKSVLAAESDISYPPQVAALCTAKLNMQTFYILATERIYAFTLHGSETRQ
jgi:hypothetical protein